MAIFRRQHNNSIVRNFVISLTITLILIAGIAISASLVLSSNKANEEVSSKTEEYLTALVEVLKTPLWNFDDKGVELIGAAYAQNDFIGSLTIENADGQVLFSLEKPVEQSQITRQSEIVFHGKIIGRVKFSASSIYQQNFARQFLWSFLTTASIMILSTLLLTFLAFRLFFKSPFHWLEQLVEAYSKGNDKVFEKGSHYIEFQPFVDLLNKMATTIRSQIQHLREANDHLESRVAHRTSELAKERNFIDAVIETQDALVLVLDKEANIIQFNHACEKLSGYAKHEVLGRTLWEAVIPPEIEDSLREVFGHLVAGDFPNQHENEWITKTGERRLIAWNNSVLLDDMGKVAFVIGTGVDTTERRKSEQALAEMQDRMVVQQKMATIGQLTATVSHELRNPLGSISMSLFSLKQHLGNQDEKIIKNLERAERNIARCDNIINDLLDFSRIREAQPEPTFLDTWVHAILAEQEQPDWLEMKLIGGVENLVIDLDQDRFRRVVINLYENAMQALDGAREKEPGRKSRITISTQQTDDRIEIIVSDTGPGIPPEVLENIYEPLFSTKIFGVGLGLPTVRQIMKQEGGDIDITSNPGKGTVARVWIPLAGRMREAI